MFRRMSLFPFLDLFACQQMEYYAMMIYGHNRCVDTVTASNIYNCQEDPTICSQPLTHQIAGKILPLMLTIVQLALFHLLLNTSSHLQLQLASKYSYYLIATAVYIRLSISYWHIAYVAIYRDTIPIQILHKLVFYIVKHMCNHISCLSLVNRINLIIMVTICILQNIIIAIQQL